MDWNYDREEESRRWQLEYVIKENIHTPTDTSTKILYFNNILQYFIYIFINKCSFGEYERFKIIKKSFSTLLKGSVHHMTTILREAVNEMIKNKVCVYS